MALLKICLVFVLIGVCFGEEWTKCEPSETHVKAMKECVQSELHKEANTKEEFKELHKSSSQEDLKKVFTCAAKAKGILNDKNEYVEEKAVECMDGIKTTDEIKQTLKDGVVACGKDLDHKSEEDQKKIFHCTKELLKEHCH